MRVKHVPNPFPLLRTKQPVRLFPRNLRPVQKRKFFPTPFPPKSDGNPNYRHQLANLHNAISEPASEGKPNPILKRLCDLNEPVLLSKTFDNLYPLFNEPIRL